MCEVKRQSTNETYTRHTIVEKVPRNFVFHRNIDRRKREKMVQPKIDEKIKSLSIRKYLKSYGIPDWALKQVNIGPALPLWLVVCLRNARQ